MPDRLPATAAMAAGSEWKAQLSRLRQTAV